MVSSKAKGDFINFEIDLPDQSYWNGRFQFRGNGGWGGELTTLVPAANYQLQLADGYAVAATDTGHTAALDSFGQPALSIAYWTVGQTCDQNGANCTPNCKASTGKCTPNTAALKDFAYRAVHKSTIAAKAILSAYYGNPAYHSYFFGCSTGGRQALVEAQKYPSDYDGIVAGDPVIGDPFVDFNWNAQNFLQAGGYVDPNAINLVNQNVTNQCGDPSGPAQGLVLNPATCHFDPATLLCASGQNTNCLTAQQVASFNAIYQGAADTKGKLLYPGYSKSDPGNIDVVPPDFSWENWITGCSGSAPCDLPIFLASEPWGGYYPSHAAGNPPSQWAFQDQFLKYFVFANEAYNTRNFGNFDSSTGAYTKQADLKKATNKSKRWGGDGLNPNLKSFAKMGHKLIITHGWSDPAISPFSSINYFNSVQGVLGSATTQTVRLFMVPGMNHCGGGPGPNVFDSLTPMTTWVENGIAPDGDGATGVMVADHYYQNDPNNAVDRMMPLCSYPEQPTYVGPPGGPNNAYMLPATNWVCQ